MVKNTHQGISIALISNLIKMSFFCVSESKVKRFSPLSAKSLEKGLPEFDMQEWIDERIDCRIQPQQPEGNLI